MAEGKRVALALGSGGARGYAHIGVIEELVNEGFEIVGIAGTSMGALVGGLYAAGKLDAYAEWVKPLSQRDVFRLLDPSLTGPGVLRADKVFAKVSELIQDALIEELPIPFTAVATDLTARKEVWFQKGRLDAAIRASIAIPGMITPVVMNGRLLADGGLMNPLPVVAMAAIPADVTVAVSLTGEHVAPGGWLSSPARESAATATDPNESLGWADRELIRTFSSWLRGIWGQTDAETTEATDAEARARLSEALPSGLRTRDVLDLALDTLRSVVAHYRLAGYPPDILITIPRESCRSMDFHKAREMIQLGRERTRATLEQVGTPPP